MLAKLRDPSATSPERLENPVTELEAAIEGRQMRDLGRQDPTINPDVPGGVAGC